MRSRSSFYTKTIVLWINTYIFALEGHEEKAIQITNEKEAAESIPGM